MPAQEPLNQTTERIQRKMQSLVNSIALKAMEQELHQIRTIMVEFRLLISFLMFLWGIHILNSLIKDRFGFGFSFGTGGAGGATSGRVRRIIIPHQHCNVNVVPTVTYIPFGDASNRDDTQGRGQESYGDNFRGVVNVARGEQVD